MLRFDDTQNKILGHSNRNKILVHSNQFYFLVSSVNTLKSNFKFINNIIILQLATRIWKHIYSIDDYGHR